MTRFPVDGTGRLSSERDHPTADLVGPAGGDLSGSYPNPTVGSTVAKVLAPSSNGLPDLYMPAPSGGDDTTALQAVLSALPSTGGRITFQPGAKYTISDSLLLPQLPSGSSLTRPTFVIEGNGAQIWSSGAMNAPIMTHTFPTTMGEAANMSERKFMIRGLGFFGIGGSNWCKGLQLACTENSHIEDCIFAGSVGLELTFCLGAQVNNCEAIDCNTYGFVAQSANGLWTGATVSNTPSNQTKFQSCRNYARTGMTDAFHIYGSNGVAIDQCTCEGGDPTNNIYFDSANDGTVKNFSTRGVHFENTPTGANIVLKASGRCIVEAPWIQAASTIMIDGSGSYAEAFIEVRSVAWIASGVQFKCTPAADVFWSFDFVGTEGGVTFDPSANASWSNGTAPQNLYGLRRDGAGAVIQMINPAWFYELIGQLYNHNAANETTSATAGANGDVPAQVKGYLSALDSTGGHIKIPYYAA